MHFPKRNGCELIRCYLLLESKDRVSSVVDQDATIAEAENLAFDLEHDVAIDVGDGEVALRYREEFPHDC